MPRYYDMDKLSEMIQAKADTLVDGKEAFLYVAKWLELLPADDVVPRAAVEELTAKVEELENELSWKDARPTMYVSKECPNCGRVRVEHYTNGKHVCEKCHWCIEENQYREDIFDYL